jgi:hypothetical protein
MRIMFAYSARKKTANIIPSTRRGSPATISLSPSATSKGARFVSASPEMKYTKNIGRSGSQNQWKSRSRRPGARRSREVHALPGHERAHEREAHRELVGDHLRRRAHRAEEGVLRVRRPAGDDHAVDAERGHGEQHEDAGVDVGDHPSRA